MKPYPLITHSEDETIALGERLGALLHGGSIVLLDGDLGAGKTRFAQGVASALGVAGSVTSPTFNLVLEYPLGKAEKAEAEGRSFASATVFRHFDLYRLDRVEQLDDLDYFGLIEEQDAVSLIEWGCKFASALPLDYILIHITVAENAPEHRLVEMSAQGISSEELLGRMWQSD